MSERLQVKVYGTPGRQCEISKELLSFLHGKRDAAAVESKIILSFIGHAQKVRH